MDKELIDDTIKHGFIEENSEVTVEEDKKHVTVSEVEDVATASEIAVTKPLVEEVEIIPAISEIKAVEISIEEGVGYVAGASGLHSTLPDRNDPNQHVITAITGLREELDYIESPRVIESNGINVATYYKWKDTAYDTHGYFVSVVDGDKIQICNGSDIFGVVVESAGFIGNQTIPKRDNSYGLVVTSGLVDVRCELDVEVGDSVTSNNDGKAAKTTTECGYTVIATEEKHGVNYAVISLGVQACTTDILGKKLNVLSDRVSDVEDDLVATMNAANEAYNKANACATSTKEAVEIVGDMSTIVEDLSGKVSDTIIAAEQARNLANLASVSAEASRQEAVKVANDALANVNDLLDGLEPISSWGVVDDYITVDTWNSDGKDISKTYYTKDTKLYYFYYNGKWESVSQLTRGAEYLTTYIKNDVATKAEIYTVEKMTEENKSIIEKSAESIQSMVSSVDKYSVGEFSQSYGLTYEQAKSILTKGMIYVPTKHSKERSHSEKFEDTKEENYFTPGGYYEWDGDDWIEHSNSVAFFSEEPNPTRTLKYWYIDSNDAPEGYEPHSLYACNDGWQKVAMLSGNANSRLVSMITQTANEIGLEITNATGDYSGLNARLEADKKAQTTMVSSVVNEDGTVNASSIMLAVNKDGSSATINANKIQFKGFVTFLEAKDVGQEGDTTISGNRITTGVIQSHWYTSGDEDGPYSEIGTSFNLETGAVISKNFAITDDGHMYVRGTVDASSGHIGNLVISDGALKSSEDTPSFGEDDPDGIYIGTEGMRFGNALTARIGISNPYIQTRRGVLGQFEVGPDLIKENISGGTYALFDVDKDKPYLIADQTIPQRLAALERRIAALDGGDIPLDTDYAFDILVGQYAKIPYDGVAPIVKYYPVCLDQPSIEGGYISFKALSHGVGTIILYGGAQGVTINYPVRVQYGKHTGSYTVDVGKSIDIAGYVGVPTSISESKYVTCNNNGDYITITGNKVTESTTIYVYVDEHIIGEYQITVKAPNVHTGSYMVAVGETISISGYISDSPTIESLYKFVECSNDGTAINVTGLTPGTAIIKVFHSDTLIGEYNVVVFERQLGTYTMYVGQSQAIGGYYGTAKRVQCPSCATYVNNGSNIVVTAISAGSGKVLVYGDNDVLVGRYDITVKEIDTDTFNIKIDEEFSINNGESNLDIICPECVTYKDNDGGELIFVGVSKGSGTIIIRQAGIVIGQYNVVVDYKDADICNHVDTVERKEATCTEDGYIISTCSKCGRVDTQILNSGHKWSNNPVEYGNGFAYECEICGTYDPIEPESCDHASAEAVDVIAPTCTDDGYTQYKCSLCGWEWKDDETEARGHNYVAVVTAPTCTAKGYTTHTCSRCNDSYKDNYTDMISHSWSGWTTTIEPDCDDDGSEKRTCSECGKTETNTLDALGHLSAYSPGKEATCTEDGYTASNYCSRCDTEFGRNVIKAKGHTWDGATCASPKTCSVCGATEGVALGHNYDSEVTPPTCEEYGYTLYTCRTCGDTYTSDSTEPTGHNWGIGGGWHVVIAATCTDTGEEKRECLNCQKQEYRDIPATGHSTTSTVTAPTCTTEGYTTHACSNCHTSWKDSYTAALGHNKGNPVIVREPTCTKPAEYAVYCTRCDVELDRYENDGEFAEHIADGGTVTKEPTCTTTGIRKYYCRECGTWVKDETIPALEHDWSDPYEDTWASDGWSVKCKRCELVKDA